MRPRFDLDGRCRAHPVLAALRERVLVWDGAMGSQLQLAALDAADFDGKEGCNEILSQTRPGVVRAVHDAYLQAGADGVETNTFGGVPFVLAEYGLGERAFELARRSALLARDVARAHSSPSRPRFVAGSIGPGTKLPTLGHIGFGEMRAAFAVLAGGLIEGGVDLLQVETIQDLLQARAAILGARDAMARAGREVPIAAQITIETTGTMLVGSDVGAALAVLEGLEVDVVGLNCATGPDRMVEAVRFLGRNAGRFVSVLPNAGLPRNVGGHAVYDLGPDEMARQLESFVRDHGVSLVGGCCGTTPDHTRALAARLAGRPAPRRPAAAPPAPASLYQATTIEQSPPPLLVGERANSNGSRRFKELLLEGDLEHMIEVARGQVEDGAHLCDVSVAYPGRDEAGDIVAFLGRLRTATPLPIVVDSTQLDVMVAALETLPGRSILNSVNLEDGEEKADRVLALAREHGCLVVALTIDEEGMARTAEKKLAIARRLAAMADRHGLPPGSLLFDALTFTVAAGDAPSRRAAVETLDAVAAIKREIPGARTLLGVSNVSFGLKPAPRQVLNSVFLADAVARGLDAAIVHAGGVLPLHRIPAATQEAARDLLYDRRPDPLTAFLALFDGASPAAAEPAGPAAPPADRLRLAVIDGRLQGLAALLEELAARPALELINELLLPAMREVGELFGAGKLQLPFVLKSAETMKAAVRLLEPRLPKDASTEKGVLVLATVKGDVHDIGKNLVDIILTNNGYRVVNLGIRQPLQAILDAAAAHKADAIGLSGLLVKSTAVMKENLEEMAARGLALPVICGGAALNRGFVDHDLSAAYRGGPVYYGTDAFAGLRLMDEICGHAERKLTGEARGRARPGRPRAVAADASAVADADVRPAPRVPEPPFWGTRVIPASELDWGEILGFVNQRTLFRGQWGYRQGSRSDADYERLLDAVVRPRFRALAAEARREQLLRPAAVYGYFPAAADGNDLVVFHPDGDGELLRVAFPRQPDGRRLCIASFFQPINAGAAGERGDPSSRVRYRDVVAFQLVTMGSEASAHSARLFAADRYDDYLHFHGLSVDMAEALAEVVHRRVRRELGIAGADAATVEGILDQGYQGSRYSFGYPACPRLEDEAHIMTLLDPIRIGVALSEEFMLVPEQLTSAIVCHHPEARYFNV